MQAWESGNLARGLARGGKLGGGQAWERGNLASGFARGGKLTSGLLAFNFDPAAIAAGLNIAALTGLLGASLGRGAVGLVACPGPVLLDTATPFNFIRDCFAFSWASLCSSGLLAEIGAFVFSPSPFVGWF